MPKADVIFEEAAEHATYSDVNKLHHRTYLLMKKYRRRYYERKVDDFLSQIEIERPLKRTLRNKMLRPVNSDGKEYSNFMEEASRRVSQSFQTVSGALAELCAERVLIRQGLKKDEDYARRKGSTDITVYYRRSHKKPMTHKVEVKNVRLRERAIRGLAYDGNSLFGFFEGNGELKPKAAKKLNSKARSKDGFVYLPPKTLNNMDWKGNRFRSNNRFGKDMSYFARNGRLPST